MDIPNQRRQIRLHIMSIAEGSRGGLSTPLSGQPGLRSPHFVMMEPSEAHFRGHFTECCHLCSVFEVMLWVNYFVVQQDLGSAILLGKPVPSPSELPELNSFISSPLSPKMCHSLTGPPTQLAGFLLLYCDS